MRFIKFGLSSVVILFLIITAISALIPSSTTVTRTIDINAPFDSVYNSINNLAEWHRWMDNMDSAKCNIADKAMGNGAKMIIEYPNNTHKTSVEIVESTSTNVKTVWRVNDSKPLTGDFYSMSKPGVPVTLQWQFVQKVKWYPWQKFSLIFSDKAFGPFMERSLDSLKQQLQQPG